MILPLAFLMAFDLSPASGVVHECRASLLKQHSYACIIDGRPATCYEPVQFISVACPVGGSIASMPDIMAGEVGMFCIFANDPVTGAASTCAEPVTFGQGP